MFQAAFVTRGASEQQENASSLSGEVLARVHTPVSVQRERRDQADGHYFGAHSNRRASVRFVRDHELSEWTTL